ncbi:helix-turn-helix domain-containing protein [Olleya sp. 1-3]|uniref:helix-turn-helix domain-containing protein n=1 Tax=Olleya sp. 1-3 TaxID=2058323 RepID=UPI000C32C19A|nr:helix-turn-helix transcriptional regulator [Olleya sp. 1-3]PKG50862.1 AraC family transcriptional regulator [Olleya sp. 1-3]
MNTIPILNIEEFEEDSFSNFYSNDLSIHLKNNAQMVHKPHSHNFYLCVFFLEGTGTHEIDFSSYDVLKGSVFFLRPGQTHSWSFTSAPRGYIFFHTQEFYEFYFLNKSITQFPFYYSYENPPYLVLNETEIKSINSRFEAINIEFHKTDIYKKQKLASLINLTYIDLSRIYSTIDAKMEVLSSSYLNALSVLEQTIEAFYKTEKSAKFYADKLSITVKHLNRITKSTINKTTTQLITERVLLEAKRLIVHSKNSFSRTAETLGYNDYAHFSKLFKMKVGITPLDFKKRYEINDD